MPRNLPLFFFEILAAGVLLDKGVKLAEQALQGSGGGGVQAAGLTTGTAKGGLANPFPHGWVPNRADLGYDGTFTKEIQAPVTGTIMFASDSFSNWGGYMTIKADQQPQGAPSDTFYFAEGIKPIVTPGQHVSAGTPIAIPAPSPYGDAYGTTPDGSGQIEWGAAASPSSVGQPTDPLAETGVSNPAAVVGQFLSWAEQSLGLPSPSQTGHAGYA